MSTFYRVNFETTANADLRQAFALTDQAQAPVDLTAATLKADFVSQSLAASLVASTGNGQIAIVDAPAGKFEINVPATTLRLLPAGTYDHDLLLTLADGRILRLWAGSLNLIPGVTS